MDRNSLQLAIAQTLGNYQRCGMRWISDRGELPAQWVEWLSSLSNQSAAADDTQSINSDEVATRSAPTPPARSSVPPSTASVSERPFAASLPQPVNAMANSIVQQPETSAIWETAELDDAARHNLFQILDQEIRACRKCVEICPHRRQTVFGEGPIRPTLCFMGEAPGADEDAQGRPFVGRAGQLLTSIIGAMQLKREEVYILNSLKCRPPGNRNPVPDEIANCYPYVESQLETLRPKFIVCLGASAARSLLKRDTPVGQLRGRFYQYRGAKVLVTYHPSYLLRNESAKRLVWEDMQFLMRELGIALPPKKQS